MLYLFIAIHSNSVLIACYPTDPHLPTSPLFIPFPLFLSVRTHVWEHHTPNTGHNFHLSSIQKMKKKKKWNTKTNEGKYHKSLEADSNANAIHTSRVNLMREPSESGWHSTRPCSVKGRILSYLYQCYLAQIYIFVCVCVLI